MRKDMKGCLEHALGAVLLLMPVIFSAQAPVAAPQAQDASQNPQAVSQTGVFPVFAVNMNFQGSLVDGAGAPSQVANSGVDNTIQQAWDTLKASGFNTILFKVDLKDPLAAARTANLCIWAKANNANLIPVLVNASSSSAEAFPPAVISLLRAGDGQQFAAYTQVSYFQLENPVNFPLPNVKTNLAEKQKQLLETVDSLRNAEVQALAGDGVQPTPIMLNASFDYELVQQGAITGVPLDAAAEEKAVAAFKKSLASLAGAANVNAVIVSWFPRSISSGDEGHFVSLLHEVEAVLPEKKVLLDTGFSTAFNSGDQQNQFMTIALTNLAGLRASEGADGRFLGVGVSQAFNDSTAQTQAPAGSSDPSQWNWNEKAKQLAQMWSQGAKSADLTAWLTKVRAGRALLTTQAGGTDLVASPGLQAIQQFSATVAQVSQNITPATATIGSAVQTPPSAGQPPPSPDTAVSSATMPSQAVNPSSAAMAANGAPLALPTATQASPSTPSVYSQMLQALVQQVTTQLTTAMVTKLTNKLTNSSTPQPQYAANTSQNGAQAFGQTINATTNYNASPQGPANPAGSGASPGPSGAAVISLGPQDVTLDVANPATGQPVHITAQLHNSSVDQDVSGLTVQLLDAANPTSPQASQSGVAVPRSGVVPVQLTWTAGQPTGAPSTLLVQVLDANGAQVASAGVPTITIASASTGANPGTANAAPNGFNPSSQTTATQAGQSFTSGNTTANAGAISNVPPNASNPGSQTAGQSPQRSTTADSSTNAGATANTSDGSNSGSSTASQPGQTSTSGNSTPGGVTTTSASANGSNPGSSATQTQPGRGPASANAQSGTLAAAVQPQIVYFGPVAATGQNQPLSLQVTNPAATLVSSAQAQLFVDGKPGPVQTLGPLLPSQTRSATFDSSTVAAGNHNIKVVVTTADGASATATASPAASLGTNANKVMASSVRARVPVRSGVPAGYQIGTVTTAPTASGLPSQAAPGANPRATTALPASTTSLQTPASANPRGATTATASSNLPNSPAGTTTTPTVGSNQTGNGGAAAVPTRSPRQPIQVRTITPQASSAMNQAGGTNQGGTTPTVVPPANASQPIAARTVLPQGSTNQPGTVSRVLSTGAYPTGGVTTVQPAGGSSQSLAARTVVPSGSNTTNQTTTVATVLTPRPGPGTGITTAVAPGPGTTQTSAATTVLPPARGLPGQPVGATTNSAPGRAYLDLSVAATEIRFRSVAPGQPTTFTAIIHNLGTVGAQGASVVFMLNADGRITSSRPSVFNVPAGGSFQASWTAPMPAGQSVQLAVQVVASGDINPANNQAVIRLH